jgi:hypothetical protein
MEFRCDIPLYFLKQRPKKMRRDLSTFQKLTNLMGNYVIAVRVRSNPTLYRAAIHSWRLLCTLAAMTSFIVRGCHPELVDGCAQRPFRLLSRAQRPLPARGSTGLTMTSQQAHHPNKHHIPFCITSQQVSHPFLQPYTAVTTRVFVCCRGKGTVQQTNTPSHQIVKGC